jgi:uncharacterized Ntn-hydrolase superfamily protein
MLTRAICRLTLLAAVLAAATPAQATWSIIIVDRESKEIAIGSATCLTNFNLKKFLPVVMVDVGAGAAQSSVDMMATNRQLIRAELLAGTHPAEILTLLEAQDSGHQTRQYGIVDTLGRAVTFSGSQNGDYANGMTGQVGSLVYAIQGNVITGQCVLDQIEAAILETPGDLPEKLMAAMEAAYDAGGDGRCSCDAGAPPDCGCPPAEFDKTAHIGFMVVTRRGDIDGVCTRNNGCCNGTYFLNLNIRFQVAEDPDPVIQLREQYDAWRAELVGVPDAVASTVTITPAQLLNDGVSTATMRIEVLDWRGLPVTGVTDVIVEHDPDGSAGASTIGAVSDLGNGVYEAELTAGTITGRDRIAVRVTDPTGERYLIPSSRLQIQDQRSDLNGDGIVDLSDLAILLGAYGQNAGGDIDGDGDTDLADLASLLGNF